MTETIIEAGSPATAPSAAPEPAAKTPNELSTKVLVLAVPS